MRNPLFSFSIIASLFGASTASLLAADFSWDGEPGVTVGTTTTQFGPATGSVWISGQPAASSNWTAGNGITGANTPWINDPTSIAQFKSLTNGTVPASLAIALGENITLNKIDVGGSFVPLTITNSGANTFNITLAQNGANAPTLAPNKPLTMDVVLTGTAGLTKINAETATLTKANTYTGTTSITTGTLAGTNALSFSNSAISVTSVGQAWFNGTAGPLTFANAVTLNAGNAVGALRFTNSTLTGDVTLAANSSVTAIGSNGTISGAIGDGGTAKGLTFVDGIVNLTGTTSNTYTGQTTLTLGTLNLNKTGATAIAGNLQINNGTATWVQANQIADTASITVAAGAVNSANKADTLANLTINSATASTFSGFNITNTLTVTTGTHDAANSGGSVTANKAVLSGNSTLQLGANSGASTMTIGSGGLTLNNGNIKFGNAGGAFAANFNLGGDVTGTGTNNFTAPNTAGARNIDLGGAGRTFNITSGVTSVQTNVTVSNGSIVKSGAGTLLLGSSNPYAGGTSVTAGALVASNATGSATGLGNLDVSAGATLAGNGRIGGLTTVAGIVSPGADTAQALFGLGTLSVDNNLILNTGSSLVMEALAPVTNNTAAGANPALVVSNPGVGAQQDFLNVSGNLQLSSGTVITLNLGAYSVQQGDIFDLLDVGGTFNLNGFNPASGITVTGSNTNGLAFDTSKFQEFGVIVAVPEPSVSLTAAGAALALSLRRSRRRK